MTDDVNADRFAPYITDDYDVFVPTIVVYEVYRKLLMETGQSAADAFAANAMERTIMPLSDVLAVGAAQISVEYHLSMADAIIYASALARNCRLVTGDPHFRDLPGVVIP